MQAASFVSQVTGLTIEQWRPRVRLKQVGDVISIEYWDPALSVPQPTAEELAAGLAAPEPVANLAAILTAQAAYVCAAISAQIVPDVTHQNAYINAAQIVGPGATVPTVDPAKTSFANLAAAFGQQPQAFATMVTSIAAVSLQLSAYLATAQTAAATAKTTGDLATALSAFETGLSSIVAAITGAGLTITAPAAIMITGINA